MIKSQAKKKICYNTAKERRSRLEGNNKSVLSQVNPQKWTRTNKKKSKPFVSGGTYGVRLKSVMARPYSTGTVYRSTESGAEGAAPLSAESASFVSRQLYVM